MSKVEIEITQRGVKEIAISFRRRASPAAQREALNNIGAMFWRRTRQLHERQVDPWGNRWRPLSPYTVRKKGHATILYDTGRLLRSYHWRLEGNNAVRFGTDVPYAAVHQFGTKRVPRRPILPLTKGGKVNLPQPYWLEIRYIIEKWVAPSDTPFSNRWFGSYAPGYRGGR